MSKWSGLAPAVDAHLARWEMARRNVQLARDVDELRTPEALARFVANQWGYAWTVFGATYGIPGPDGVPMATSMIVEGGTICGREQYQASGVAAVQGAKLAEREYEMLNEAVSHYVSAEVVDEVSLAASMAHNDPIYETDLFTPCGFAVFEKPMIVPDLDPDSGRPHPTIKVHIRAIGWRRIDEMSTTNPADLSVGPGVMVHLYTTKDDYHDGFYTTAKAAGVTGVYDVAIVEDGFLPVEVIAWRFGRPWDTRDVPEHVPGTVPGPVGAQRRWFYAFMRLCWQQIIVRHKTHEPRHNLRRWDHRARRKARLDYTVLRLRRIVDPYYRPTGMGQPLEYRIKVRAHWMYAYCASIGGAARLPDGTMDPLNHRWVWIESYWKGPEDGEIGPLHSATSVVR